MLFLTKWDLNQIHHLDTHFYTILMYHVVEINYIKTNVFLHVLFACKLKVAFQNMHVWMAVMLKFSNNELVGLL